MSLTLTQWCEAIISDLDRLETKLTLPKSDSWLGTVSMCSELREIENDLSSFSPFGLKRAWDRKPVIIAHSIKIGSLYPNPLTTEKQYLPDIHSPVDLLFAIVFLQSLKRYQKIDRGSMLALPKLRSQRPMVLLNEAELKRRIDVYCCTPGKVAEVEQAFKEVSGQSGETLYERVVSFLFKKLAEEKLITVPERKPITVAEEKLISILEADAGKRINLCKDDDINELFLHLNTGLRSKEAIIRKIASYQKLIEVLNTEQLSVQELNDPDGLKEKFPQYATVWLNLNKTIDKSISESSTTKRIVVGSTNLAISTVLRLPLTAVGTALSWMPGWRLVNGVSALVANVGRFVDSKTPDFVGETHRRLLITEATRMMSDESRKINGRDFKHFKGDEFINIPSQQITDLADKVATIRHMLHIQECIVKYRQEHHSGIVKWSLSSVFRSITTLLSKSFLRPLIFDKVLLQLAAENLEKKLGDLIKKAEAGSSKKSEILHDLKKQLKKSKQSTLNIGIKSQYLFFKNESEKASQQLDDLMNVATHSIPKLK